ncbi:hypothetical protein BAUCODRAFT_123917 [Baudoinia panamericana UAMH 10762]|uniref:Uncharacterized protein n=1 Tax=Baudoinia panamericana (strain UAMH 10762) TaxID=717646 RepID=M2N8R8_BAUPA|nr:uncharacterized protein BAUCODRAFT_123917 [Baudoinia panamericana UAMH 10762]EMC95484.1 hypothetical protein BAUCODRAFT_123917 [Baudoinia panamericana UAMH 10762]
MSSCQFDSAIAGKISVIEQAWQGSGSSKRCVRRIELATSGGIRWPYQHISVKTHADMGLMLSHQYSCSTQPTSIGARSYDGLDTPLSVAARWPIASSVARTLLTADCFHEQWLPAPESLRYLGADLTGYGRPLAP